MSRDELNEEIEFEQRDARYGWWEALFLGIAIGIAIGAFCGWLTGRW